MTRGCHWAIEPCCHILSLAQFSNLYEGVRQPSILPFSHWKKNLNGKRLGGCHSTIESCCNILSLAQFSNLYEGVRQPSILPFSHWKKNLNGKRLGGCHSTIESCCNILSLAQFSNLYEGVWLPSILPFSHCKKQLGGQLGGSMVEWRPPSCLPFKTMAQLPFPSRRLPIFQFLEKFHSPKKNRTNKLLSQ